LSRSQILRSLVSHAHQELDYRELRERIAMDAHCPVHGLLLSGRCLDTMTFHPLHPADARNAQGDQ